jgi:hypothetical protein
LAGRARRRDAHVEPSAWKNRKPPEEGVRVFDLTREIDTDPKERAM